MKYDFKKLMTLRNVWMHFIFDILLQRHHSTELPLPFKHIHANCLMYVGHNNKEGKRGEPACCWHCQCHVPQPYGVGGWEGRKTSASLWTKTTFPLKSFYKHSSHFCSISFILYLSLLLSSSRFPTQRLICFPELEFFKIFHSFWLCLSYSCLRQKRFTVFLTVLCCKCTVSLCHFF